jgi:hypothetical protein
MDGTKQAFPVSAVFPVENEGSRDLVSGMGVDLTVDMKRLKKCTVGLHKNLSTYFRT